MIDSHYACNEILKRDGGKASCCYCTGHECEEDKLQPSDYEHINEADNPEDAAAKLCIELFKQGVLTKEQKRKVEVGDVW